jgi:hypothetical protein
MRLKIPTTNPEQKLPVFVAEVFFSKVFFSKVFFSKVFISKLHDFSRGILPTRDSLRKSVFTKLTTCRPDEQATHPWAGTNIQAGCGVVGL